MSEPQSLELPLKGRPPLPGPPSSPEGSVQPGGCGRGAACSQQPRTSGRRVAPSRSCPPPAPYPGPNPGRGRSRSSAWAAEPSHSWQGSPRASPTGAASRLESRIRPSRSVHCPGITSSGGAGGRKVREFWRVQPCAERRGIVSAATGGVAPARTPSGHPRATVSHRPRH